MSDTDELAVLLKLLQVSDPGELIGKEERVAINLIDIIEDPVPFARNLQQTGLTLRDTSLIKISALMLEFVQEKCLMRPFDSLIEFKYPLAGSIRDSFFSSGPDLYLVTTKEDVDVDERDTHHGIDPEVRPLKNDDIHWRVQKMNHEKNEFSDIFVSGTLVSFESSDPEEGITEFKKIPESNPTVYAIGYDVFAFLGSNAIFYINDDMSLRYDNYIPFSIRPSFQEIIIARHIDKNKFMAIVRNQYKFFFGIVKLESSFEDPDNEYTVFTPILLPVVKTPDFPTKTNKLRSEGLFLGGGFEIFFKKYIVIIARRLDGPVLGVLNIDYLGHHTQPDSVEDQWIKLSDAGRITKLSEDHFYVGKSAYRIDTNGIIYEMKSKPMEVIQSDKVDSNIVYYDDAFYYFRGKKMYVLGKSMKEDHIFWRNEDLPLGDPTGTNYLLEHNKDLYWIHIGSYRVGFITKMCFPLIARESMPPTLLKRIFPKKRKSPENASARLVKNKLEPQEF